MTHIKKISNKDYFDGIFEPEHKISILSLKMARIYKAI